VLSDFCATWYSSLNLTEEITNYWNIPSTRNWRFKIDSSNSEAISAPDANSCGYRTARCSVLGCACSRNKELRETDNKAVPSHTHTHTHFLTYCLKNVTTRNSLHHPWRVGTPSTTGPNSESRHCEDETNPHCCQEHNSDSDSRSPNFVPVLTEQRCSPNESWRENSERDCGREFNCGPLKFHVSYFCKRPQTARLHSTLSLRTCYGLYYFLAYFFFFHYKTVNVRTT
jgi:hypothetical protein